MSPDQMRALLGRVETGLAELTEIRNALRAALGDVERSDEDAQLHQLARERIGRMRRGRTS